MQFFRLFLMVVLMTTLFVACGEDPENTNPKCENGLVWDAESETCVDLCENVNCCEGATCNPTTGLCEGECTGDYTISQLRTHSQSVEPTEIGDVQNIEGIVVAVETDDVAGEGEESRIAVVGFYLEEEGAPDMGGIYINYYSIKTEADAVQVVPGNKVKVAGTYDEYFDFSRINIISVDQVEILEDSVSLPAAKEVGIDGILSDGEKYESMLVSLTGGPFTVVEAANGENHYNTVIEDSNGNQLKMMSSLIYPFFNPTLGTVLDSMGGIITYDWGEFKILPRPEDKPVDPCDGVECNENQHCVNGECVDNAPENTDETCSDNIDNDGDGFTDCEDYDCINSETVTVCEVEIKDATIAEIRQNTNVSANDMVRTTGLVVATYGGGYWIQDGTSDFSGIYVYDNQNSVAEGDQITIVGKYVEYYDLSEIKNVSELTVNSSGNTLPAPISVSGANIADLEAQESMLVEFSGGDFTVTVVGNSENFYNTEVQDEAGNTIKIKSNMYRFTVTQGQVLTQLKGVITYDYEEYKILPRKASDMGLIDLCEDVNCDDGFVCDSQTGNCVEAPDEICDDDQDNDGDGFVDCDDYDCDDDPACEGQGEICDDNEDNDGDGFVDCDDWDCDNDPACGGTAEICDDNEDNDGDGFVDCDDYDCDDDPACGGGEIIDTTIVNVRTRNGIAVNDNVRVTGVVVAAYGGGYWIQDGTDDYSGIYVYDNQNVVVEGDEVTLAGQYVEYYDLSEIKSVSEFNVDSSGNALPTPITVSGADIADLETQESMLVQFSGGNFTVTVVGNADNFYNTEVQDQAGNTIKVKSNMYRFTVTQGQELTQLMGVLTYDYGEYKILPRKASDMGLIDLCEDVNCDEGFTCDPETGNCVEAAVEICDDNEDNDGDGFVDCDDYDCDDDPACGGSTEICDDNEDNDGDGFVDCDDWDCDDDPACGGGEVEICDDNEDNDGDGFVDCDDYDCDEDPACMGEIIETTIINVRTQNGVAEDDIVKVTGIVTVVNGTNFWIQSGTEDYAAIYVYNNDDSLTFTLGDEVTITGKYVEYFDLSEISNVSELVVESSGNSVEMTAINATDDLEPKESMVVTVNNAPFTVTDVDENNNITVTDANGDTIVVDDVIFNTEATVGNVFTSLTGVLSYSYGAYKVNPRDAEDAPMETFTCDPACEEWEACVGENVCALANGRCESDNDCETGLTCNLTDHVCEMDVNDQLVNGDLETWDDASTPTEWMVNEAVTATQDDTNVHGGSYSAMITRDSSLADSSWKTEFLSPAMAVDTTTNYNISMYVLDNDVNVRARIYFRVYNAAGDSIGTGYASGYSVDGTDWQELTFATDFANNLSDGYTLDDIASIRVGVRVYAQEEGTGDGFVNLDDLTLTAQ